MPKRECSHLAIEVSRPALLASGRELPRCGRRHIPSEAENPPRWIVISSANSRYLAPQGASTHNARTPIYRTDCGDRQSNELDDGDRRPTPRAGRGVQLPTPGRIHNSGPCGVCGGHVPSGPSSRGRRRNTPRGPYPVYSRRSGPDIHQLHILQPFRFQRRQDYLCVSVLRRLPKVQRQRRYLSLRFSYCPPASSHLSGHLGSMPPPTASAVFAAHADHRR
jgi:hypothetical protein